MTREEFEAFFRKNFPGLVRNIAAQGFPREVAMDAAQEAMYRLLRDSGKVEHPAAWVRKVAFNEAQRLRARPIYDAARAADQSSGAGICPPDSDDDPDFRLEAASVLELLRSLPPKQRSVMAWHLDGYTPQEIAKFLGVGRDTVDSNLRHARLRLRRVWTEARSREEEA